MNCLHPFCPMNAGSSAMRDWNDVIDDPRFKIRVKDRLNIAAFLNANFEMPSVVPSASEMVASPLTGELMKRLLQHCPCLYTQIDRTPSARGIVHQCEVTMGARIDSANVDVAFRIQDPRDKSVTWKYPPLGEVGAIGGHIMEIFCSEVLTSEGIPAMLVPDEDDPWPVWQIPGHIMLNEGGMRSLRAFGDILIPCAPTNLVISVKSTSARERLLYSSNSIEGLGFGFFDQPDEFWSNRRMTLYKRMGFSAIYMPNTTYASVMEKIASEGRDKHAVNLNGTALYRPHSIFGEDMRRVVGKSSLDL